MCIGFRVGISIGAIQVWGNISKVFGGMVRIGCISLCVFEIFGAW